MPPLRLTVAALTLIATTTLVSACGSGDGAPAGSSTSPGPVTASTDSATSAPAARTTTATVAPGGSGPVAPDTSRTSPTPTRTVRVGELEDSIKTKLTDGGNAIEKVDCPDQIEAKVGNTADCHVKAVDGREADYTVTITSVNGDKVLYDAAPKA